MTGKQFLYYLIDIEGNYYYVDNATGEVLTTATKTPIKDSPLGWSEQGIKFGRDEELWGVFQSITTSLKFWGDGKKILESIYYHNDKYPYNDAVNFEAYCQLVIEKRNDSPINTWGYDTWFNGKFDFSEVAQNEDEQGNFIQVLVIENSLKQIFDANRGTEYEIPITGHPFITEEITMEGVVLDNEFEWITGALDTITVAGQGASSAEAYIFPMGLIEVDSTNYFRDLIYFKQQDYNRSIIGSATPNTENAEFLKSNVDFTGTVTLNIEFNWASDNPSPLIRVVLLKQKVSTGVLSNAPTFTHDFYNSGILSGGGLRNVTFTNVHTEPFEGGDWRYLVAFVGDGATSTYYVEVVSATMNIKFKKALPTTSCYALSYQNYAKLLVEKAFEGQATLSSQYLGTGSASAGELLYKYYDLLPKDLYITTGDALRKLPDPVIKGSLSDLIKDVYSRCMCGVGISGSSFVVERLDYFLQKVVKIGTVKNTTKPVAKTAKSLLFNDITVGYPEFKAEDLNGRFEVNSTQKYKMGFKTITDDKDLTTSYKASVYEIEYLRSEIFSSGNTKDNNNDNSIYLLHTQKDSVPGSERMLKKYTTGQIVGVPSPTTHYNIALSPKRNILRHIPYLKSILNVPDGILESIYEVDFIGGDRNTNLETRINGAALWTIEYDNVYPSEVPLAHALPRLFKPLSVQFDAFPQPELLQAIRNNPYGYLEVINGSEVFGIFITDIEINGADMASYKFTGLLHPDSDTKQFIS